MATTPVFIASGFATPCVPVTAISTDRTGGGTYTTILTAPSGGAIVEAIKFQAQSVTSDTVLLLFINDASVTRLIDEIRVPASAPTMMTTAWTHLWVPPSRIFLPNTHNIRAAMLSGPATINAWIIGGLP